MSYRIEFVAGAQLRFHSLPEHAQDALIQRAADLAERPWDDVFLYPPGDDARFRETVFDAGHGVLDFYVDDEMHVIRIFDLLWVQLP